MEAQKIINNVSKIIPDCVEYFLTILKKELQKGGKYVKVRDYGETIYYNLEPLEDRLLSHRFVSDVVFTVTDHGNIVDGFEVNVYAELYFYIKRSKTRYDKINVNIGDSDFSLKLIQNIGERYPHIEIKSKRYKI